MKEAKLNIVISSPDEYADVFKVFIDLVGKNWKDCKYDIILANNVSKENYRGVKIINTGFDTTWCDRVKRAIQTYKSKYILLITDDSFIGNTVDSNIFNSILDDMTKFDIKYYRLYNSPKPSKVCFNGIPHLRKISKRQPYGINLMAAIWNTEHFLQLFGEEKLTGWDIESKLLEQTHNSPDEFFENYVADNRNILSIIHGVSKGKWMLTAIWNLRKIGYNIEIYNRDKLNLLYEIFLILKKNIRNILPNSIRKIIKQVFSKLGFNFASKY